jgi:hypothetical protein
MSAAATAGLKQLVDVFIDMELRHANGYLGFVHNTSDTVSWLGCDVESDVASRDPGLSKATCHAEMRKADSTGTVRIECTTRDPEIVNVVRALKTDSALTFSWNTANECDSIMVETFSYTDPKRL